MEFLNIGIQELILILVISMIVLGPDRIISTGRKMGETIRKIRTSETWKLLTSTSQGLRNIPSMLADETGFEYDQFKKDVMGETEAIKKSLSEASDGLNSWRAPLTNTDVKTKDDKKDTDDFSAWTTDPPIAPAPPPYSFPSIRPPKDTETTETSDDSEPSPKQEIPNHTEQSE